MALTPILHGLTWDLTRTFASRGSRITIGAMARPLTESLFIEYWTSFLRCGHLYIMLVIILSLRLKAFVIGFRHPPVCIQLIPLHNTTLHDPSWIRISMWKWWSQYSYTPHNDVSVNDGPLMRRWSHKIIILYYNIYHCFTIVYSIQYSNILYKFVA